jgi:hypothetical protein
MIERRPPGPPPLFARAISVAAHPLVVVPLTIALTTRSWRWTTIVAATTILPIAILIFWNVRRGVWSDYDVSQREQRSGLYWAAIPLLVIGALVIDAPPSFMRGMFAAAGMLLFGLLGNRFLKTSMHMMFAVYCAVILARAYPWSPLITIPVLLALAWSRRRLERHTTIEILVGFLVGAAAGAFVIL